MDTKELLTEMVAILDRLNSEIDHKQDFIPVEYVDHAMELWARLAGMAEVIGLQTQVVRFDVGLSTTTHDIAGAVRDLNHKVRRLIAIIHFSIEIHENMVSLTQDDIDAVQALIDQCRTLLGATRELDERHKRRLLIRLEALQKEIHKTRSNMDVALAGLVEVGDAFGKFGDKVKPLVDRFREIASVFNGKSEEPLQLPAPQKQLPPPESENSENK